MRRVLEDVEVERGVLGGVLTKPGANDHVLDGLKPNDFSDAKLRSVFSQMVQAREQGVPLDVRLVASLGRSVGLDGDFVGTLRAAVATFRETPGYADRLKELGGLRELRHVNGAEVVEVAPTLAEALAALRGQLDRIEQGRSRSNAYDMEELARITLRAYDDRASGKTPPGIPIGVPAVDPLLGGGMARGGLYIVAALRGHGKSSLLRQSFGAVLLETEDRALMFSLEMDHEQVNRGITATVARADGTLFRAGKLPPDDEVRMAQTLSRLAARGRHGLVVDRNSATLEAMVGHARDEHARAPLSYVFVDYLQLVDLMRKTSSREQHVSAVARGLKNLAMDLGCVVIAAAQVNRAVAERSSNRLFLSDLRESGEIEQAADGVIFIYPQDLGDGEEDDEAFRIEVAKHRHGPADKYADVRFTRRFGRFDLGRR